LQINSGLSAVSRVNVINGMENGKV